MLCVLYSERGMCVRVRAAAVGAGGKDAGRRTLSRCCTAHPRTP